MHSIITGNAPVTGSAPVITLVGGTGFLGRYIARVLAKEGYRLKIISRHPNAALGLKTIGDLGQIVLLRGDISRQETITPHLAGSSVVINLVGLLFERGRQSFTSVHAQGAEKLAQAAKAAGVGQFIHVSALGVDRAAASRYARTKLQGEKAVQAAFPETVILRPSVIFGPEDGFYNRFAAMAAIAPFLPLIGGGKTKFQPVYAGDVARAVLACIKNPATGAGRIFELGGPEIYSFRQVLEYIVNITGRKARLVNIPFGMAQAMGSVSQLLPTPPLTQDQVKLLQYDNVVMPGAPGFAELGIQPGAVEMIVPDYLRRFAKSGKMAAAAQA